MIGRISDFHVGSVDDAVSSRFVSVYLTVRSGFFQVDPVRLHPAQHLWHGCSIGVAILIPERMTPFQATSTSLAGTVGMGNMAGVATALSIGGPGAIFWMWVLAFFGMITKAAEVTIGGSLSGS